MGGLNPTVRHRSPQGSPASPDVAVPELHPFLGVFLDQGPIQLHLGDVQFLYPFGQDLQRDVVATGDAVEEFGRQGEARFVCHELVIRFGFSLMRCPTDDRNSVGQYRGTALRNDVVQWEENGNSVRF